MLTALGTLQHRAAGMHCAMIVFQIPIEIVPHYQSAFDGLKKYVKLGEHCVAAL